MPDEVRSRPPTKVFAASAVKAAIWADSRVINNAVVEVHSIKFDRSYIDKDDGQWKHTNAFNVDDLPKVAVVALEVYKYLRLRSYENEDQNKDNMSNTGG